MMGAKGEESHHMLVSPMVQEKSFSTHLVIFLRTGNIWEGRTVIFPISHELVGILNVVLLLFFMNFYSSLWEWVPKAKETTVNQMRVKNDAIYDPTSMQGVSI